LQAILVAVSNDYDIPVQFSVQCAQLPQ